MTGGRWLPSAPQVTREAIAVVVGAVIAAVVFQQFPALREWVAARLPTAKR